VPVADDEVIEHPHVHECQRLLQAPRDELIRLARLEDTRWMVVGEDQCRGVVQQGLAQHLARVNAGAVDRAAEQLFEGNQPVAVVEVQAAYLNLAEKARQRIRRDR
jgi:hypothetical protein